MIDLPSQRIVVAGGSGFIGSHVVAALLKRGVPKRQITILKFPECDLRVLQDCANAVRGADVVFDCAAVPGDIMLRAKIPGKLFYENLIMGVNLVEAAAHEEVKKMITVGSVTEYPEAAPVPLKEEDLWRGLPSSGNIPYGLSKRIAALQGDMERREKGLNAIHLLLTNAYGPGERFESGYMVPSLIQKALTAQERNEREIEVWGTGRAVRDIIFVEDAAEGIIRAAERYDEAMPLNIGSGAGISIKDLVALLCAIIGFGGAIRWDTGKPEGDLRRPLDTSRAKRAIEFEPRTSLEEGLARTISWHRAQVL